MNNLLLASAYRWEAERPHRVFLTQPIDGGECATGLGPRPSARPAAWLRGCSRRTGSPAPGCHPLQKLRLVDHGRSRHLDGRPCQRTHLPVA